MESDHTVQLKKHLSSSKKEPQTVHQQKDIKCDQCVFKAKDVQSIVLHLRTEHKEKEKEMHCKYCEHTVHDGDDLKAHMIDSHVEVCMIHTMAQQMEKVGDSFELLETFKGELANVLKIILDNQNAMKQELFLIRNKQVELASTEKKEAEKKEAEKKEAQKIEAQKKEVEKKETEAKQAPKPKPLPPSIKKTKVPASVFFATPSLTPIPQPSPRSASSAAKPPPPPKNYPRVPTPPKQRAPEMILYIGDSISANVNIAALEIATQAQFVPVKAYCSVYDTVSNVAKQAAKFPSSNFTDVVQTQLGKEKFKHVILQAGSVDITNLNTKDDPMQYMEYFRQETIMSATNLFQAGVNALRIQPTLAKVVIMKQIPRYDPSDVDPMSLKASLALLFNNTLANLWMESPDKHRLFIGNHNIECNGAIRESRYRHTKSGRYDGIHLYGNSGSKAYTLSVLNILRAAQVTSSEDDYHQSCAQFQYQQKRSNRKQNVKSHDRNMRPSKNFQKKFSVPTHSRFEPLVNFNQGN